MPKVKEKTIVVGRIVHTPTRLGYELAVPGQASAGSKKTEKPKRAR